MINSKTLFISAICAATAVSAAIAMSSRDGASAAPKPVKLVSPSDQRTIPFPGHSAIPLLNGADSIGDVAFMQFDLPARTLGAPPHIHQDEDEYAYVIEGEFRFLTEGGPVTATEGMVAALPRGKLHGFWNISDRPGSLLFAITPSRFETFFDAVVAQIKKENPDNPALVGQIIGKVSATYNVTVMPDKFPDEALQLLPK